RLQSASALIGPRPHAQEKTPNEDNENSANRVEHSVRLDEAPNARPKGLEPRRVQSRCARLTRRSGIFNFCHAGRGSLFRLFFLSHRSWIRRTLEESDP